MADDDLEFPSSFEDDDLSPFEDDDLTEYDENDREPDSGGRRTSLWTAWPLDSRWESRAEPIRPPAPLTATRMGLTPFL